MQEVAKKQNIISQWLWWQFFEMPGNILKAWKNFLLFNLNYFSIFLLLKTLFSPWRGYKVSQGKGFDFGRFFEAVFSNLIFRALGAVVRSFLIFIGIFVEFLIIMGGIIVFLVWLVLPALLIVGFLFGIIVAF
ncbi:MAG: hypothetical protein ABIG08_01160 [bacterium]